MGAWDARRTATDIALAVGLLAVSAPPVRMSGHSPSSSALSSDAVSQDVGITLGMPQQVLHRGSPDAMGLFNVPDMHTALLRRPDNSYWLWITGNIGPAAGSIARLSTKDFLHYENAGPGAGRRAQPVMTPSCRPEGARNEGRGRGGRGQRRGRAAASSSERRASASCAQNYDADYVGANAVMTSRNQEDLLMFYEAGTKTAGDTTIEHGWEYNVMALARSSDNGLTWKREGVVLSGSDPKPTARTTAAQPGVSEPGTLVVDQYIYMFFQYIGNRASADAPSVVQVARAPVASDGAPGAWSKYYNGSFSQPGLGGLGTPILATEKSGCTRPVQVWPATSTYLNAYVLTYLCNEGWFFSTSKDLVTWSPPTKFLSMAMFKSCQPMDWNFMFVTPGNQPGVIGQKGLVLYAHSDSKGLGCGGFSPHMLWVRPFEFQMKPRS